jgi:hypothetical protein
MFGEGRLCCQCVDHCNGNTLIKLCTLLNWFVILLCYRLFLSSWTNFEDASAIFECSHLTLICFIPLLCHVFMHAWYCSLLFKSFLFLNLLIMQEFNFYAPSVYSYFTHTSNDVLPHHLMNVTRQVFSNIIHDVSIYY